MMPMMGAEGAGGSSGGESWGCPGGGNTSIEGILPSS